MLTSGTGPPRSGRGPVAEGLAQLRCAPAPHLVPPSTLLTFMFSQTCPSWPGSYSGGQGGFLFVILLPQPPEYRDQGPTLPELKLGTFSSWASFLWTVYYGKEKVLLNHTEVITEPGPVLHPEAGVKSSTRSLTQVGRPGVRSVTNSVLATSPLPSAISKQVAEKVKN